MVLYTCVNKQCVVCVRGERVRERTRKERERKEGRKEGRREGDA